MDWEELGRMAYFSCIIKKSFYEETIAKCWISRAQIFEERTFQTEGTVDAKFLWKYKSGVGEEQKKVWGPEQCSQGREENETSRVSGQEPDLVLTQRQEKALGSHLKGDWHITFPRSIPL